MKAKARSVFSATAPVFGAIVSIAVMKAAGIPFPPPLTAYAWPDWVILSGVGWGRGEEASAE